VGVYHRSAWLPLVDQNQPIRLPLVGPQYHQVRPPLVRLQYQPVRHPLVGPQHQSDRALRERADLRVGVNTCPCDRDRTYSTPTN
jgi:hypothetical protein